MNMENKWENFARSGKIADYLAYRREADFTDSVKEQTGSEIYDRRTCNKREQCR